MDWLGHEVRKIAHFLLKLMKQSCYIISQEITLRKCVLNGLAGP